MAINIQVIDEMPLSLADRIPIPKPQDFEQWVNQARCPATPAYEVTICLVSKEKSAALNQQYRHKSGPTNILSFGYTPIPGTTPETLGDLVICPELVMIEAYEQNKLVLAHFAHLTIHGMLHLQGYDHELEADAIKMEQLEIRLLQELGFSNPYATT